LNAALRIERAVEHPQIRIPAAGVLQQIARLGQADALLDLRDRLGEAPRPRERHAQRVVGLGAHGRGLARPGRAARRSFLPRRLAQRALGPLDGAGVVAGAKCGAAHPLKEVRTLEPVAAVAQAIEAGRETGAGALTVAGLPVQPADLPLQACPGGAIVAALDLLPHRLVVRERLGTPSDEPEQIGEALPRDPRLRLAQLA